MVGEDVLTEKFSGLSFRTPSAELSTIGIVTLNCGAGTSVFGKSCLECPARQKIRTANDLLRLKGVHPCWSGYQPRSE